MRLSFLVAAGVAAAAPALAVEAPSARLLHRWPQSGAWSTALIRTSGRDLACYTAAAPIAPGSRALPGLRIKGDDLAVEISDRDGRAVAGGSITVIVDGAPVGRFAVSDRLHGSGMTTVVAEVPAVQRDAVMAAFQRGRTISFVTRNGRYTASLAGTSAVADKLIDCLGGAHA